MNHLSKWRKFINIYW